MTSTETGQDILRRGKLSPDQGHFEKVVDELVDNAEAEEQKLSLSSSSPNERSHYIYYLKVFLDVGFLLLVIPFRLRLKLDRDTGRKMYKLHSNKLQQTTCAVFQAIVVFELFSILRLLPSFKEMQKKPLNILQSGNLVASLIYTLSLLYIFWFKRRNVEDICLQLQDNESLPAQESSHKWKRIQVKLLSYAICCAAYIMAMTHPVIHEAFVFETDLASFFERMSMQARACFLMTDTNDNHNFESYDWRAVPAFIFTCIHTLIWIPSAVLTHMLDLFALLTTICCWDVMKNFMRKCKDKNRSIESGEEYFPSIIHQYTALKRFFKSVNNGVGLVFLCCIGISLPIYATWIAVKFFDNDNGIQTYDAIHFYIYFFTFLFVLSMAARINQRANEFYDWIGTSELHTLISPNMMTVLMMDLHSNRIALSGCGIFVINFRFLVTILSIIVTYTSIIVQFQLTRGDY